MTPTINFAAKLDQLPHYEGGMDLERARRTYEADGRDQARLQRVALGPAPGGARGDRRGRGGDANRYPDPEATLLRERLAERFEADPAGIAVSNGSCEILLAAALALCEPGAEIVYAWPSFSMYPHLRAALGRPRDPRAARRRLRPRPRRDARGDHRRTQIVLVCNPNNPTGTLPPAGADRRLPASASPTHVTVILDEAYVEFQTLDDPDATVDLLPRFPNLVLLRTFSKVYGLAGPARAATRSARPRSAPPSTRCASPSASTCSPRPRRAEAILHQRRRRATASRATVVERIGIEEELRELGLRTADTQANFSWVDLGDRDEDEVVDGLGRAGVDRPPRDPARRPRPHPRQLRHPRRERALPDRPARAALSATRSSRRDACAGPRCYKTRNERHAHQLFPRRTRRVPACLSLVFAI